MLTDFPPSLYLASLNNRFVTELNAPGTLQRIESKGFRYNVPVERRVVAASRNGLDVWGLRIGNGSRRASITAGAHSDEPVGPLTAMALAEWLVESAAGRSLLTTWQFTIFPNVNPDGADANKGWFNDPVDPAQYLRGVMRELPGNDVEFNYPDPSRPETWALVRPENRGVAEMLREGAPFDYHVSLHGMAYAEGAWFLIGKDWVARTAPLRDTLRQLATEKGFPLHDIERHGDKGFHRIEEGFCTTPTSVEMKEHFLRHDDASMADKFHLSSMEYVRALGGDPLVMVSELPLFQIGDEASRATRGNPPGPETIYTRFRAAVPAIKSDMETGHTEDALKLMEEYSFHVVPLRSQIELQAEMIVAALQFLEATDNS